MDPVRPDNEPPYVQQHIDIIKHEQAVRDEWHTEIHLVKAQDLFKTYAAAPKTQAVCGVTFGVKPGETLGLLGPNGAGKTSTFNAIAMQEPRSYGEVVVADQVESVNLEETHVALCPQHHSLFDSLTVRENLKIIAGIKGLTSHASKPNIDLIIKTMGLSEFMSV